MIILLKKSFPNEWKFVGDGQFILAGKCPDFINVNGQKKIIEFFGNYWHKLEEEQQRINLFTEYGYQTLIIWEHELKDIDKLSNKLLKFNAKNNFTCPRCDQDEIVDGIKE